MGTVRDELLAIRDRLKALDRELGKHTRWLGIAANEVRDALKEIPRAALARETDVRKEGAAEAPGGAGVRAGDAGLPPPPPTDFSPERGVGFAGEPPVTGTPPVFSEKRHGPTMAGRAGPQGVVRLCGICRQAGHRRETCPQRAPAVPAAEPAEEPEPARAGVDPESLVVANLSWAEDLARRRSRRYPGMDEGDAIGEAHEALVAASRSWRPEFSVPFRPWAAKRIMGAIVDAHRRADPAGRHERRAQKNGIETKLARRGVPRVIAGDIGDLERDGFVVASRPPTQIETVERAELLARVRALPLRLAVVMERHAFGDEGLAEIGASLGITESRVCQIVRDARALLTTGAPPPARSRARPPRARIFTREPKFSDRTCTKCGEHGHDGRRHRYEERTQPATARAENPATPSPGRGELLDDQRGGAADEPTAPPLSADAPQLNLTSMPARAASNETAKEEQSPPPRAPSVKHEGSVCQKEQVAGSRWDRADPNEDLTELDLGVDEAPSAPAPPVFVTPPRIDTSTLGADPTAMQARLRAKLTVIPGGRVRSKTIAAAGALTGRLSREEMKEGAELLDPAAYDRPQTRGDCDGGARPCPWVSCSHHLALDANPNTGALKLNFPHLEVWEMAETCSLDVADRGGITLEQVGAIVNLTRERVRQVEVAALTKIKDHSGEDLETPGERFGSPLGEAAEN